MERVSIPLKQRPFDILLIAFFAVNAFFVCYMFDIEQVTIPDTTDFTPPFWPPMWMVNFIHWYGRNYDPLLMARPAFWKGAIWIDLLFFGPFYFIAIYAYWRGLDWIRFGSIAWAFVMLTNNFLIFSEEIFGIHRSPNILVVFAANSGWIIVPVIVLYRMSRSTHPFTKLITNE